MLQKISERIQGWVAGVIIVILAAAFILFGVEYYLSRGVNDHKAVAKVGNITILDSAVIRSYQQLLAQARSISKNQSTTLQQQQYLQSIALDQLITQAVLVTMAEQVGFYVSPIEVKSFLLNSPMFQVKGQFSPEHFKRILYANKMTEADFVHLMQSRLLILQSKLGLQSTVFILPTALKSQYKMLNETRDIGYFSVNSSDYTHRVKVNPAALTSYYKAHASTFKTPESIRLAYLKLAQADIAKKIQLSKAEIAKAIRDRKIQSKGRALQKAKIIEALKQQKVQQAFSKQSDILANVSYTEPDSLKAAAHATGLSIQTTGWISRQGDASGVAANPAVIAAAYSDDVLLDKNNSNPITLKNGDVVVLRVLEHRLPKQQSFKAVKQEIQQRLIAKKAQDKAGLIAYQISDALQKGNSIVKLQSKYAVMWHQLKHVKKGQSNLNTVLVQHAFTTAKGHLVVAQQSPGHFVILKVLDIHYPKVPAMDSAAMDAFRNARLKYEANTLYQHYIASARQQVKVKRLT